MSYLQIASKVMTERASKFELDRDQFIAGLTEDERTAYDELKQIMTSGKLNDGFTMPRRWSLEEIESFRLSPGQAHMQAKAIIERYRQNRKRGVIS